MLDFLTPSGGRELDLFTLGAQIAVPLTFALLVALVPARRGDLARWLALAGLACSLTLASCRLVDYHTLLDGYSDRSVRSLYHPAARLDSRSEQQSSDASEAVPKPFRNDDLVVRRVWLGRLDLDFALGLDGLSLLLILTLNAAAFGAVLSSWQEPGPVSTPLALTLAGVGAVTGALLSLDLVLFLAFGELGVACCIGLLASWGVLRPRALVLHGLAAASLAVAILTLHGADVRDVVPAGEVAASAAEMRQLEPRTPPDAAEAAASVHRLDPVALARFQRAATLIHTGQADRLAVRTRAVELPRLGADPDRVADLAPGVDRTAALGRVAAQFAGTPRGQRLVFGLVAFAALARLLVAPWQLANLAGAAMPPAPAAFLTPALVGLTTLGGYTLLRHAWPLAPLAARDCAGLMASVGTAAMLGGLLVALAGGSLQALACGPDPRHRRAGHARRVRQGGRTGRVGQWRLERRHAARRQRPRRRARAQPRCEPQPALRRRPGLARRALGARPAPRRVRRPRPPGRRRRPRLGGVPREPRRPERRAGELPLARRRRVPGGVRAGRPAPLARRPVRTRAGTRPPRGR